MTRAPALLLLLASCALAIEPEGYPPPTVLMVEGSQLRVYHDGQRAVAMRIDRDLDPRRGRIHDRAARAMAEVSGCRVRRATLHGNAQIIRAELDCG